MSLLFFWPDSLYVPGLGIALMVVIVFAFGSVVDRPITRWALRTVENALSHLPLLKAVYIAIRDFTEFLKPNQRKKGNQVVAVKIPGGIEFVGLVMREDLRDLPKGITKESRVAVYIPISYQLGGYTMFVPRDLLTPIEISVEEAMRSIVTAWLPGGAKKLEMTDDHPIN